MSSFKYPYQCTECGSLFVYTTTKNCCRCHTNGTVVDLRKWEQSHLIAAIDFIKAVKTAKQAVIS